MLVALAEAVALDGAHRAGAVRQAGAQALRLGARGAAGQVVAQPVCKGVRADDVIMSAEFA